MQHAGTSRRIGRSIGLLLMMTIAMTALADWLFYHHPIGWTVGLYTLLLTLAVIVRYPAALRRWSGRLVVLTLLGLIGAMVDWPGWLEIIFGAMLLIMLVRIGQGRGSADPFVWIAHWLAFLGDAWRQVGKDAKVAARGRGRMDSRRALLWIIPLMLTAVFVALFAEANPIIENWLSTSSNWLLKDLPHYINGWRAAMWVGTAIGVWSLLRWRGPIKRVQLPDPMSRSEFAQWITPQLIVRCLVLFNLVFAVETALDLMYLTGGRALPAGMTYTTYARRGAYPLVATALLAGAFVLICFRTRTHDKAMRIARALVYVFLVQNVLLLFSAGWRLYLYVGAFSLTRWRCAAAVWMIVVAFGFITVFFRILCRRDNGWLARVNGLFAMLVIYACCFVNFDAIISDFNARHCREITGETDRSQFDTSYVEDLGPESLPALRWLEPRISDPNLKIAVHSAIGRLTDELRRQHADWRGWTWRTADLLQSAAMPVTPITH